MIATLVLLTSFALAGDPKEDPSEQDDIETYSGKDLPKVDVKDGSAISAEQKAAYEEREFENVVYIGAEALDLEPAYVHGVREGLKMLYLRDYKGTRKHFETFDKEHPGTGISAVADTLVWQALMLENFDFRYDKQYKVSSKQAQEELAGALKEPGQEAWEHFLMAGMLGVEAIHTVRHEQYLSALQTAFDAMDHVARAREAAPDFTDLLLADGMYNYWRTVITMSTSILPDFGDHRAEGILQLREVEDSGIFLSEPATLALVFTWLEERELKRALESCVRNRRRYPDNVINNLLTGQTYTYMRKYDKAIELYDEVVRVAPENDRVNYYKGLALMRSGQSADAIPLFDRYLSSTYLEDYHRAAGHYRRGQAYYRQKDYVRAEEEYKAAVKVDGYKPAKNALARMKKLRKEGRIDY